MRAGIRIRGAFGELDVGNRVDLGIGDRDVEAIAQAHQRVVRHLLLVRRVLRFARSAHAEALDRLREDQGRLALVFDRGLVGSENLAQILAATVQRPDLIVGPVGDHRLEFRRIEEVLADIGAVLRT